MDEAWRRKILFLLIGCKNCIVKLNYFCKALDHETTIQLGYSKHGESVNGSIASSPGFSRKSRSSSEPTNGIQQLGSIRMRT
jgi:hypothetical protein